MSGEDRTGELIEAVMGMARAMPTDLPVLDCALDLVEAQAFDQEGQPRAVEQQLMMTAAAYAAALRLIQQLTGLSPDRAFNT